MTYVVTKKIEGEEDVVITSAETIAAVIENLEPLEESEEKEKEVEGESE